MRGWIIVAVMSATAGTVAAAEVDYARDVKPIFASHCHKCHGPEHRNASLRLDHVPYIREGGDSGPALQPGDADASLLIRAVTGAAGFRMPPEDQDDALSEAEIAILRQWIQQGAQAPAEPEPAGPPPHWAFVKPAPVEVPAVRDAAWVRNPIDAFIAAEHEARGLKAAPPASPEQLLRRVYLDLVGVPPTPQQLRAFLDDRSDGAYERVVDDLLASPLYGQRWGRHWMDIWRYSDWYGYKAEIRNSQKHIWRWRDWIIESLNRDQPYDQMITHMLAGDEVAPGDPQALAATGYLARHWYKFNRHVWLDSVVEHTGKAFLGVTFNCARCHEHKYDPISQRDYFRMRAFFEPYDVRLDRIEGQLDVEKDALPRVYDAHHDRLTYRFIRGDDKQPDKTRPIAPGFPRALAGPHVAIEPVSLPLATYFPGAEASVREPLLRAAEAAREKTRAALETAALDAARERIGQMIRGESVNVSAALTRALAESQAAETELESLRARIAADDVVHAGKAGDAAALKLAAASAERRAKLHAAQVAVLAAEDAHAKAKDTAKAAALKKVETARAAAEAAVKECEKTDDVYTSLTPVYPATSTGRRTALARWITSPANPLTARVAVNHIWTRHFDQPLVDTVFEFGSAGHAPSHPHLLDWLALRFIADGWSMKKLHRLIVTSSTYRMDSSAPSVAAANAVADPDNRYLWKQNVRRMEAEVVRDAVLAMDGRLDIAAGGPEIDHASLLTTHRRSLYYRSAPEKQATFMMTFDAASPIECYRRNESIVPQQALAMANSTLTIESSRLIAAALAASAADEPAPRRDPAFLDAAFIAVLSRHARSEEIGACLKFLDEQEKLLADPAALTAFDNKAAAAKVKPSADPRQRARENLVHVLLNHNDFVTVR